MQALLSLILSAALLAVHVGEAAASQSYASQGPFAFSQLHWKHAVPLTPNDEQHVLDFTVTFPVDSTNEHTSWSSYPLVFFYPGFEMPGSYYKDYAEELASWGYVVVQYDVPLLPVLTDTKHVEFFPSFLTWFQDQLKTTALPVNVDFSSVAIAGHSRGAKLAALIALKNPVVKAIYLIDPVDGQDGHAQNPVDFPSAISALKGQNRLMAVAASSITGSCNPEGYNYPLFWETAGERSWLTVVARAGHCQFLSAPPLQQWLLNRLCKKGRTTSKKVIETTYPSMVAWFESIFRSQAGNEMNHESHLAEFFLWIDTQRAEGNLKFYVKGDESIQV